jgi:hypothetical protein
MVNTMAGKKDSSELFKHNVSFKVNDADYEKVMNLPRRCNLSDRLRMALTAVLKEYEPVQTFTAQVEKKPEVIKNG